MNRTLKFRIWDDKLKQFNYFDIFNTHGNIPNDCKDNIQQFTGLLDKNGREIYDGDIIKCIIIDDYLESDMPENIIQEVKLTLSTNIDDYECGGPDGTTRFTEIEIIGNIFESPDLLFQK